MLQVVVQTESDLLLGLDLLFGHIFDLFQGLSLSEELVQGEGNLALRPLPAPGIGPQLVIKSAHVFDVERVDVLAQSLRRRLGSLLGRLVSVGIGPLALQLPSLLSHVDVVQQMHVGFVAIVNIADASHQ